MAREKILVVEDEEDILELVRYNLTKEGYQVSGCATGEEALEEARNFRPDLALLDLMLPGMDGLEVCRRLRSNPNFSAIPIIILTAKGEEADIVSGLEVGADDYMTKPFSPRVLLARVRAVLRRGRGEEASTGEAEDPAGLQLHDLVIQPGRHEVMVGERRVELTFTEMQILQLLARRPGWVFTRYQIIDAVRGEGYPVTDRSVDVQIAGLRKKLGSGNRYIETIRGVGYRFRESLCDDDD